MIRLPFEIPGYVITRAAIYAYAAAQDAQVILADDRIVDRCHCPRAS